MKTIKRVLLAVGILLAIGIGSLAAMINLVDPNDYKPELVGLIEENTGRVLDFPGCERLVGRYGLIADDGVMGFSTTVAAHSVGRGVIVLDDEGAVLGIVRSSFPYADALARWVARVVPVQSGVLYASAARAALAVDRHVRTGANGGRRVPPAVCRPGISRARCRAAPAGRFQRRARTGRRRARAASRRNQ